MHRKWNTVIDIGGKKRKEIRERERGVEKKTQDSVKSSVVDLMFTLRVVSRTAKQIATYHVTKVFNALYVEYGGR